MKYKNLQYFFGLLFILESRYLWKKIWLFAKP